MVPESVGERDATVKEDNDEGESEAAQDSKVADHYGLAPDSARPCSLATLVFDILTPGPRL